METCTYREAKRVHTSVLAAVEKRCLIWMAERLPRVINSDHLTFLAALAMAGAGVCYAIGPSSVLAMGVAILLLAVNWFGDSLDGTVARVRSLFNVPFGFAGLTLVDGGFPVPCRLLIAEMARLGCSFTFLRRSFHRDIRGRATGEEVPRILQAIAAAAERSAAAVERDLQDLSVAIGCARVDRQATQPSCL